MADDKALTLEEEIAKLKLKVQTVEQEKEQLQTTYEQLRSTNEQLQTKPLNQVELRLNPKELGVVNLTYPFVNRRREIIELCYYSVKNLASRANQKTTQTLMLSAQMFGAGKTVLGSNFLLQLSTNPDLLEESKKALGDDGIAFNDADFDHLLNMHLAFVELQHVSTLRGAYEALIEALIKAEMRANKYVKGTHPKLEELRYDRMTFNQIVRVFEAEFGHSYFIQFDGIGRLLSANGLKGCAEILDDLALIQSTPISLVQASLVYVSSRSPLIYVLGMGQSFRSEALKDWNSPCSTRCVVFDTLKPEHILKMMEALPQQLPPSAMTEVAATIYTRTGGVPRFIREALTMIRNKDPNEWKAAVEGPALRRFFLDNLVRAWLDVLNPPTPELTRGLAVELIRLASLATEFSLGEMLLDPIWTEAVKSHFPNHEGITLTSTPILLCAIFPLYLARVSKERWKFVIPPVCLEVISAHHMRLPFLPAMEEKVDQDKLELMVARCVRLRVSDSLVRTRGQQVGTLLPFLAESLVAQEVMQCSSYAVFPKLVADKAEMSEQQLQKLMEKTKQYLPIEDVNRSQFNRLLELMPRNTVVVPKDQSTSAHLFYMTASTHLIEWQMKGGAQELTPSTVVDELLKSSSDYVGTTLTTLTFIFVCLGGVSSTLLKTNTPSRETPLAYYFDAGSTFHQEDTKAETKLEGLVAESANTVATTNTAATTTTTATKPEAVAQVAQFVIPSKMEVVILKREGLRCFLTDANLQSLSSQELLTLNAVRSAISPGAALTPEKPLMAETFDDALDFGEY